MSGVGPQQRRRQRGCGRIPKSGSTKAGHALACRRIYDLRGWHKRKFTGNANSDEFNGGEPPAGWVLVWAGRFKRWRRRWFVAHPPGLLLYFKNSDQIGRPGCISLLGATALPTPGKERQLKIIKGSMVYYLRTLNRDNRQAWLDTINQSIHNYYRSLQRAAIRSLPGRSLFPRQSIPSHLKEEWEDEERELNHRLAERMRYVETVCQVFLKQLQALQQSLSDISGSLCFTKQSHAQMQGVVSGPYLQVNNNCLTGTLTQNSDATLTHRAKAQGINLTQGIAVPGSFHRKTVDIEYQACITSANLEPLPLHLLETRGTKIKGSRLQRHNSSTIDDAFNSPKNDLIQEQGRCIGREFFRWRRRNANGLSSILDGHSSDPECARVGYPNTLVTDQMLELPSRKDDSHDYGNDKGSDYGIANGVEETDIYKFCNESEVFSDTEKGFMQPKRPSIPVPDINVPQAIHGPLHAAWNNIQNAFTEVLKEEIHRVIELEAENALLQQSLAMLPQLQQDHRDLLDLRERIQRENSCALGKNHLRRDLDGEDGDDEDTDYEISVVHTEVTNEDYFEALEVLNQHEFVAKATSPGDLEVLAERDDGVYEPPEEGDYSAELSEAEGEEYDHPRTRLPAPRPLSRGFSLWTVLKNAIGKDLNRITMPATINEPLSVLQRCAEEFQYKHLLEKASQLDDPIERLLWISVFACVCYNGSPHRDAKPFNPLLGETYEWQAPDGRMRLITEQVSHHPPILAFQGESTAGDYSIYGEIEIKNKFWGRSVEVLPVGVCHLRIPKFLDHFTWSKVTTCIHNVVVGKLWIDNYGEMVIKNHTSGDISHICFHKASATEQGHITGKIYDCKGVLQCSLDGNYMNEISVFPESVWNCKDDYSPSKCLWKSPEPPDDYEQQYCFSRFAIGLNELMPSLAELLPPTDSRFRPDQRALEDGDLEKASPEKLRLEEKQRHAYKRRRNEGQPWKCMWFYQRVPGVSQVMTLEDGMEPTWVYGGEYWSAREKQAWQDCPNIM